MHGVNAPPPAYIPNDSAAKFIVAALIETPLKRLGYEDARKGMPLLNINNATKALKYEEGRLLYAELSLSFPNKVPEWSSGWPPDLLVALCLRWMRRNPDGHIVPPSFGTTEVSGLE